MGGYVSRWVMFEALSKEHLMPGWWGSGPLGRNREKQTPPQVGRSHRDRRKQAARKRAAKASRGRR